MTIAQIKLINISKSYGGQQNYQTSKALDSVSLIINKGEFVSLMGSSGCGKSTLLNIIAGIDNPSAGEIIFEDQNLNTLNDSEKTKLRLAKVGFIFQFFNLLSTLTVAENVSLPLELANKCSSQQSFKLVEKMLEKVNMLHKLSSYPSQLSGGEMQRVAIARALINSPAVILADEPTGNLDSQNGIKILNLLKDTCDEQGITIVLATHSDEAASFASCQVRMKDGAIVQQ